MLFRSTVERGGEKLVLSITLDEKPRQTQTPQYDQNEMPDSGDFDEWFEYFFGD